MSKRIIPSPTPGDKNPARGRTYRSPKLTLFGAVGHLTASGSGTMTEMAEGGGMCMAQSNRMSCL